MDYIGLIKTIQDRYNNCYANEDFYVNYLI